MRGELSDELCVCVPIAEQYLTYLLTSHLAAYVKGWVLLPHVPKQSEIEQVDGG